MKYLVIMIFFSQVVYAALHSTALHWQLEKYGAHTYNTFGKNKQTLDS